MSRLIERKRHELLQKLAALQPELDAWRQWSNTGSLHEKHRSQVSRIATVIDQFRTSLTAMVPDVALGDAKLLAECEGLTRAAVDLHRIWEYFRAKLAQRGVETLRPYLRAADELAWRCFDAARRAAGLSGDQLREPPLVFLNGGWSPFAATRQDGFGGEHVKGEPLVTQALARAVERLPVPVIGVPWTQLGHLPELAVVAHEVGHIVERDLGLGATVELLVEAVVKTADARALWKAWRKEAFADVFACVALGPAALSTLMDFLLKAPAVIVAQHRTAAQPGEYPTDTLRVVLGAAALNALGFAAEAQALEDAWRALYGAHKMAADESDARSIARALIAGPYPALGGKPLSVVFPKIVQDHKDAVAAGALLADGIDPGVADPRVLVMALRQAHETAHEKLDATKLRKLVLEPLANVPGERGGDAKSTKDADRALGDALLVELLAKAPSP